MVVTSKLLNSSPELIENSDLSYAELVIKIRFLMKDEAFGDIQVTPMLNPMQFMQFGTGQAAPQVVAEEEPAPKHVTPKKKSPKKFKNVKDWNDDDDDDDEEEEEEDELKGAEPEETPVQEVVEKPVASTE